MPDSVDQILRKLDKPVVRSMTVGRDLVINEADRTANLAFASDTPCETWFGDLILSMGKANVRTDRLDAGLALLLDHDRTKQIGIVESFAFEGSVARAIVKFSRSECGDEIFQDVKDGIRRSVSVGFMVHELHLEKQADGEMDLYRSDDWEPIEISLVSIPADISVGVGREFSPTPPAQIQEPALAGTRALSTTEKNMEKTAEELAAEKAAADAARAAAPVVETRSAELVMIDEIREWGTALNEPTLAESYIRENVADNGTFTGTKAAFLARIKAATPAPAAIPLQNPTDIARIQGGVQLARNISRVSLQAFKGEGAHERAFRSGMHLAAVLLRDENAIRYCRENGIAMTRTQTGTDNTKGGFTVLPEFEQTIFELLLQYGVARRVTDVVPMASDTKLVTRRTGGLTAYPVGAGQRGTYSTITDDQFELVARKWMVLNKREDEVSEDSYINWADRTANEGAYAFSFSEDDCLFNGDGSSTYHGIVGLTQKILGLSATRANIAGAVVASGNAWSEIVIGDLLAVVGKLPSFARSSGNVRWYCTSEFWASVLQRLALAAGGVTHAEFEGELKETFLGKPVEIVEVMQHTEANDTIPLLYGNMSQAATFGDRRGITVKMTDSNDVDFESDLEATKLTERFDINVHDVGNQSATAGLRKAGPVVALLTAAS